MASIFKIFGEIAINNSEANEEIDRTTDKAEKSSNKIGQFFGCVGKVVTAGVVAGATAVAAITKTSVQSFAEFEQLIGGSELLFGEAFDYISEKSENAYSTVQMSQNDYLRAVNGFAVGLRESLGGNEQAAAELADRILTAEADIVAATGNTQESVQNAFNGIMKGNFVMLDNLQLGITPTKEGMQEVIDKVNAWNESQGRLTEYTIDNLADMESALIDYVEMQGLAGYAQAEAAGTIEGSLASLKGAWSNLITGLGNESANMNQLMANVSTSFSSVVNNILPIVENVLSSLPTLIDGFVPLIPSMIGSLLPPLLKSGIALVEGLVAQFPTISATLISVAPMLVNAVITIVSLLISQLPTIIGTIASSLPALLNTIWNSITENAPMLIGAVTGLMDMVTEWVSSGGIQNLIAKIPEIVQQVCDFIVENAPLLLNAVAQLGVAIIENLPAIVDGIVAAIPQVLTTLWEAIKSLGSSAGEAFSAMWDAAVETFTPIVESVIAKAKGLWEAFTGWINTNVVQPIVNFFAPLTDAIGNIWESIKSITDSVWNGITSGITSAINAIKSTVSSVFNSVKSTISSVFNSIKSTATSVWNAIKSAVTSPIESARDTIKGVVDKIKSFFQFKVELPKISLPHFSISPSGWQIGDLLKGSIPRLGISWYAKAMEGMIMNKPTIFGYDPVNGTLMGGGEAGSETVVGTENLLKMINEAVRDGISNLRIDLYLDGETLVGGTAEKMNDALGKIAISNRRGVVTA